jgi:DNA-binding GntR family transcriptional regulator
MLPFKTIITIDPESKISVYRQIADSIERNIRDGMLQPGAMLPGSRKLAAMLGISRNTVVSAYNGLVAEGWLVTVERKGVIVGEKLPEPAIGATHRHMMFPRRSMRHSYLNRSKAILLPGLPAPTGIR